MRLLTAPLAALVLVTACTGTDHGAQRPRSGARAAPPRSTPQPSASSMADASTAPADTKPEEPYDLSADLQQRSRVAKEELGARTVTTIISDVFVLIGAPGWNGAQFEQSAALFRNSMAGYMNGR